MSAWSVETRRAQFRHCRDVRVYGHTTTAMHDMSAPPLVQAMSAWSVETRRAPSRHCTDARVYGHTTTAMHDMSTAPPLYPRSPIKFGSLDGSEKTITILGDRWWSQTTKQEGEKISKQFRVIYGKNIMSAQNVGGVSTRSRNGAPSRKRDAWSVVKRLRQATNEYPPPHSTLSTMCEKFRLTCGS